MDGVVDLLFALFGEMVIFFAGWKILRNYMGLVINKRLEQSSFMTFIYHSLVHSSCVAMCIVGKKYIASRINHVCVL